MAVTAERKLRDKTLHYRINNGRERTAGVREWRGGEKYGDTHDKYYAEFRGTVRAAKPADKVTVWFTATGAVPTAPFTYTVADDIGGDVLVLAAEDVTGISPANTDGATAARYADEHVAALAKAGYSADVYDMDTHGRKAPHPLGVLSHYRAVVWETGDDIIPRAAGQPAGTAARSTLETELAVRDYLNEGGKLHLRRQVRRVRAGRQRRVRLSAGRPGGVHKRRRPDLPAAVQRLPAVLAGRVRVRRRRWHRSGGSVPADRECGPVRRVRRGAERGRIGRQPGPHRVVPVHVQLPAGRTVPAVRQRGPGRLGTARRGAVRPVRRRLVPVERRADASYKRLTRTVDLTAAPRGRLKFQRLV